jgi:4-hydroxythreonine-4-phosphate dehydrogenase
MHSSRPLLLITMGDVAGIGPEIIARAWPELPALCRPVVVGDPAWLRRGLDVAGIAAEVVAVDDPAAREATPTLVPCLGVPGPELSDVQPGRVDARAGRAAHDFLCAAIDLALAGRADGIVTAPLHKEGLHAAGLRYPGHTEILAERTGSRRFAMLLYGDGLAVAHVTLHMALRDVFARLSTPAVRERIELLDEILPRLLDRKPRIAVAALNPHAGDGGLFGDEEPTILAPAVAQARAQGIDASGPYPADTLFVRAARGEFDGIVAMYHDEGHIAMKLRSGWRCVNITAGLPIVRTSVAHGTAYDIAGRGLADPASLVEAVKVAARLARAGRACNFRPAGA